MGRDPAADVDERPDEVDVEALPGVEGAGHVHVVVRVRIGGVRMQAEYDRANGHGERKQSEGNTHGRAAYHRPGPTPLVLRTYGPAGGRVWTCGARGGD